MEELTTIGKRISYTRNHLLSMNQKEFSRLLGISQGSLSEIENNKRGLPMEAIIALLKYSKPNTSVSVFWILTGETDTRSSCLSTDETELISTYRTLDRRGQHRIHTTIYEEIDRMNDVKPTENSDSVDKY